MSMSMGLLNSPPVDGIGLALLHSLWQCAVIVLVLAVMLRWMRHAAAQTRYLAASAALIAMVALPAVTAGRIGLADRPVNRVGSVAAIGASKTIPVTTGPMGTIHPRSLFLAPWLPSFARPRTLLPALVSVWVVGVATLAIRLVGGWFLIRRLCRRHTRPIAGPLEAMLARLVGVLGIRRGLRLLESSQVQVPMVIGGLRPVILMPIASLTGLPPRQLEVILAHELAHIRRHDYLVNLAQSVIELLLFYHPAAWWVSRVIRDEREHCCDDLAVRACGNRLAYAQALATMEGLRSASQPSLAASDGPLMARIRRILNPEIMSMYRLPIVGPGATALIGIVLLVGEPALPRGGFASGAQAAGARRPEERTSPDSAPLVRNDRKVYVPIFRSGSLSRVVQLQLTELVQKQIESQTPWKVVGRLEEADTIVDGTVNLVDKSIQAEDPQNLPRQLIGAIHVRVNWVNNPPHANDRTREPTLVSAPIKFAPELGETLMDAMMRNGKKIATKIVDQGVRRFPGDFRVHPRQ
ncbi:Signal transducer regulating beta-lactamase production, contains metallopeptidase domain [Singulisphaera sp. GP187]|uniref:M56 family metallopeptidase n=1 Tax=Singulisphaera sp. GP187 TaxID=1882752 RepID=UPI00092A13DE|nr:M56 family metallopeptidase [Singulisphaera sp. GP187]SIO67259.1 Signal transducer regulating beta-lactamase production, contains metallopeptidase domain [Singulisphaera sp. GP187]